MRYISNHILFLGRTVTIVLFLASSGFTTILHNCTMETAACCEPRSGQQHEQCDVSLPQNIAFQSGQICHSNTVVGGVTPPAAVLEKDTKSEIKKFDTPLVFAALFVHSVHQPECTSSHYSPSADVVFPSSVEKYVLNATFLI
jgi:hypothetical protein